MTGEKIPVVRNERNKWAVQERIDASHARCMEETFGSLPGQSSRLFDRRTQGSRRKIQRNPEETLRTRIC